MHTHTRAGKTWWMKQTCPLMECQTRWRQQEILPQWKLAEFEEKHLQTAQDHMTITFYQHTRLFCSVSCCCLLFFFHLFIHFNLVLTSYTITTCLNAKAEVRFIHSTGCASVSFDLFLLFPVLSHTGCLVGWDTQVSRRHMRFYFCFSKEVVCMPDERFGNPCVQGSVPHHTVQHAEEKNKQLGLQLQATIFLHHYQMIGSDWQTHRAVNLSGSCYNGSGLLPNSMKQFILPSTKQSTNTYVQLANTGKRRPGDILFNVIYI